MLNISIVLYHPHWEGEVLPLIEELQRVRCLRKIYLVDNSPAAAAVDLKDYKKVRYIHNEKNLGYGAAHNIAIRESVYYKTEFHLVMNSDILVKAEDIDLLHTYMTEHPEVGQLMPHVLGPDGQTQYLCKLLPSPMDLLGRRFLPAWMMRRRMRRFELRDSGYDHPMNVPYLSGCFMLLRTEAVLKARLFDEQFFMYPEDIDLTRRIHRDYLTLYYPAVSIVHNHARESYKSVRMLCVHAVNICRYFRKWGWIIDKERRLFNRLTLEQIHT